MKFLPLSAAFALLAISSLFADSPASFVGTWSAPSLSQPHIALLVTLTPDGQATEQVGTFQGTGTWKAEQGTAKISWASGWAGVLRPLPEGKWELLTWKKGSPLEGPPDDTQPAARVPASR